MPANCPLLADNDTMDITEGLPNGAQLKSVPTIGSFFDIFTELGGSLGGERETFSASLTLQMQGTSDLDSFKRVLVLPHVLEIHTSPRTPGVSKEELATDLFSLQGQITGDPDFDLLRVTAGTGFGMPSPGHTTLTRQPSGTWTVDSFFDITYRIDFVGAPGGRLAGMSGSTTGTIRLHQGAPDPVFPPVCVQADNGTGMADFPASCPFTSPSGTMDITDGLPPDSRLSGAASLQDLVVISRNPGGSLGGESAVCTEMLQLDLVGSGALAGFSRTLQMQITSQIDSPPRTPSGPFTFDTTMFLFQGQLPPGDPDFDLLRVTAGTGFGLPSPGHTTLTRQADGSWAVDSFFDITYRIDFVGAPGGPLAGMSGSTTATIRMQQGGGACVTPVPAQHQTSGEPCDVADNGNGTGALPATCPYLGENGTMDIVDGLAPGDQLQSSVRISSFFDIFTELGGSLGGERETFSASLSL
ncbi:MAG TPA: hypothetical protein P5318_19830, partial [Candidatus Hydrogenedentes bacterium]|nr:hypothetical protein [Candidatus Hydrogenedentota bacterium]